VQQWELITRREQARRDACLKEMHAFCQGVDREYDQDVRQRNRVERTADGLLWSWPKTGATAQFHVEGPRVVASVRSGLYGNDLLVAGAFPEITVSSAEGEEYGPDPDRQATVTDDGLTVRMKLPLRAGSGKTAVAYATAKLTVQTVWFWTVTAQGTHPAVIRALFPIQPGLSLGTPCTQPASGLGLASLAGQAVLRHNAKAGFYIQVLEPANTSVGQHADGRIAVATRDGRLRFATVILPAQPLNLVGFQHRMVHYIRYAEGPVQQ